MKKDVVISILTFMFLLLFMPGFYWRTIKPMFPKYKEGDCVSITYGGEFNTFYEFFIIAKVGKKEYLTLRGFSHDNKNIEGSPDLTGRFINQLDDDSVLVNCEENLLKWKKEYLKWKERY